MRISFLTTHLALALAKLIWQKVESHPPMQIWTLRVRVKLPVKPMTLAVSHANSFIYPHLAAPVQMAGQACRPVAVFHYYQTNQARTSVRSINARLQNAASVRDLSVMNLK